MANNKNNKTIELPQTPKESTPSKEKKPIWPWLLGASAMIILLIVAIIINNNAPNINSGEQASNTLDIDNGDLKINWDRYGTYDVELSETYVITKSGTYHLTGTLENGAVIVNSNDDADKIRIILDNVTINNPTGPAIVCYGADDLVIELVGENNLSDGSSYSADYDEEVLGAIYSKSDLTFTGEGTLNLTANYQDGIISKDDLKFTSGKYNITSVDDAIRAKDSVYIADGEFNIVSEADGIKSTNTDTAGKGFVLIENGSISLSVADDGIHAESMLVIQNGTVDIAKSYEGIEAPKIIINNGDVSVIASDDGINAGSSDTTTTTTTNGAGAMADADSNCEITINGGNVYVNSAGDGIDSNGYIYFNGGTVAVDGPTNNGNGSLDAGISVTMNGGTVIAVGSSGMAETLGSASSINNISVYFTASQKAGTVIKIKDSSGETVLSHTSAKSFSHMSAGTDKFITGESYTIYINDTEYESFTISSITTTIGNSSSNYNNMMPGQNTQRQQMQR